MSGLQLSLMPDAPDERPELAANDERPDLTAYDLIVICSSAGKDSMAMLHSVVQQATAAGVLDRVVVLHNDLGTTDTGESIEWEGVADLAREHAEHYGLPFTVLQRDRGGLWDQLVNERKKWPGAHRGRWCTSDQKTGQGMKEVTRLAKAHKRARGLKVKSGPPVEVLYCLGLRAQESTGRAKKPVLAVDASNDSSLRRVTRWHPILRWSVKDVWDTIKASGLRAHVAYDLGMSRLSCVLCPLASKPDLLIAARQRPGLVADFVRAEQLIGHDFQAGTSMADIQALAQQPV